METVGQYKSVSVHLSESKNNMYLSEQNVLQAVIPHVAAAAKSLNENRDDASFVVVDYGAADGLNSLPMIAACTGELSSRVSEFKWIFNDLNTHKVEDTINQSPGLRESSVKLQYVAGSFYDQVVPDGSVDLWVSVSAVHWLSQRPPKGCSADPCCPDDATKSIAAKDWVDFLHCRAKELKKGGRLVVSIFTTGDNSSVVTEKEDIKVARMQVIKDMFIEGIITKEEYEFARIFPMSYRTEADLQAPFLDAESNISEILRLVNIKRYHIPCPLYYKWMQTGGRENRTATEEFVTEHVNFTKSYYDLVWKILEETRSTEVHLDILETFYRRVGEKVRDNLERYQTSASIAVVDMVKII